MSDTPAVVVVETADAVAVIDLVDPLDVINVVASPAIQAVDVTLAGSGGLSGPTVDTGAIYRIIMFSDGTVRAIPDTATAPALPTGLARTIRINSVRLTWTASSGATQYDVHRNGAHYATAATTSYRDMAVTVGETYTYAVQAISADGLRSAVTATVSAFIDPALNVAPTVEIRTWPATIALGNRAIIRVNATDVDGQVLANLLSTDVGTLVATADPTVWMLEPA